MATADINRLTLTANLTADPELKTTPGGTSFCRLRVAFTTLRKQNDEWVERPNYLDVTVFGGPGEACAKHLARGSQVAVDGHLEWRSWETDSGERRSAIETVAESIKFLGPKRTSETPDPDSDGQGAMNSEEVIPF